MVLVVIAVATFAAYTFTDLMLAHDEAMQMAGDQVQTRAAAESGVELTRLMLAQPPQGRADAGGLFNNPMMFQAITVQSPQEDGRAVNFSVIAPGMDEAGRLAGVRFGLQNESAKLNLNTLLALERNSDVLMPAMNALGDGPAGAAAMPNAGDMESSELSIAQSLLMALPGMTLDTADAILDWLDEDDEPRPMGAEEEYYATLPTPYAPRNGPIDTVEELLLVRGVTPELLFGADANRNGVIDAGEQQIMMVDAGATQALGWSAYLTVHGYETNRRRDGRPRININQDDLELLSDELSEAIDNEDFVTFILAYRIGGSSPLAGASGEELGELIRGQAGGGTGGGGGMASGGLAAPSRGGNAVQVQESSAGGGGGRRAGGDAGAASEDSADETPYWTAADFEAVDLTGGAGTSFTQVLDLIDATVTIDDQTFRSPLTRDPTAMAEYLPLLMDNLTTHGHQKLPGRLNINECPAELLYAIPGLTAESAEAILEARGQQAESENRLFETWPLVEGLITLETMRAILPLVTTGGDVYTAQVIGYHETTSAATRLQVVVDGTGPNPRVAMFRDLSHLGRGFDLSVLGVRHAISEGN